MKEEMKILIVDDHQMFIDGLKNILKKEKGINVIGEAFDGESAFEVIKNNNNIDLVITDINMPGISGTELTKKIKDYNAEIKVLVLTMHREREIIHEIVLHLHHDQVPLPASLWNNRTRHIRAFLKPLVP